MPYSRRTEEMLIRAALTAEAHRAPAAADLLAALPDAIARRADRRRRWGMAGAAATVLVVVFGLAFGVHGARPESRLQEEGPSASVDPPATSAPTFTAIATGAPTPAFAGPAFPARYLPTIVPRGWLAVERAITRDPNDQEPIAAWSDPASSTNFPLTAVLYVEASPEPTRTATQVGGPRRVDVHGAVGTLRVATEKDEDRQRYDDDLWWSPEPGVVLTMSVIGGLTDPSDLLIPMARSVAPNDVTTEVPFRLPALPPGTSLVSESVGGTQHNWSVGGAISQHSGTVLEVSWGPGYRADSGAPNVTVRGGPGYYNGSDSDAYITTKVDGYTLTVQRDGPMTKATLVRIINEMTFYPDARYPWLGGP